MKNTISSIFPSQYIHNISTDNIHKICIFIHFMQCLSPEYCFFIYLSRFIHFLIQNVMYIL